MATALVPVIAACELPEERTRRPPPASNCEGRD